MKSPISSQGDQLPCLYPSIFTVGCFPPGSSVWPTGAAEAQSQREREVPHSRAIFSLFTHFSEATIAAALVVGVARN